jgi:hypothetical protein
MGGGGTSSDNGEKEDLAGLEELIKSMSNDLENGVQDAAKEFCPPADVIENAALKLLGYTFTESGTSYYLVKPLQPYVLVGRLLKQEYNNADVEDDSEEDNNKDLMFEFELLTPQEETMLIPKLEKICQEEMAAKGLTFQQQEEQLKNKNE